MSGPLAEPAVDTMSGSRSVVREAVIRFTAWSVVALVVLALGTLFIGGRIARDEALRDARIRGTGLARNIVAPLVNSAVRAHRPGAAKELNHILGNRMKDGSVAHIKLWSRSGEVIWSDETELVGRRFKLEEDERSLFGTDRSIAAVSDLDKAENVGERSEGELLEVYVGTRDKDNKPLLFEAYVSTDRMRQDAAAIVGGMLPPALGGLFAFQLAVLPMAISLARRVQRSQLERAKMMRHALIASDLERRRIAQDLHDGVIQDLAGIAYALPSVQAQLPDGPTRARDTIARAGSILKRDVAALRSLLTDIYPPDLHGPGLAGAVHDLARSTGESGVSVAVVVAPDLRLPPDTARVCYRVVREGLRNVVKHARCTAARVELGVDGEQVTVRVSDDGQGVRTGAVPRGHLGLRLLEDTLLDLGGRLVLRPGERGGAILEAMVPVDIPT
jgi:signal transduction histidine kinase